ncbi:MAG: DUF6249 domain-containing protein [Verrucomicrobiota bacterium]|nr:DUF6249 domain-containing protein [Verrucomicrobiota bacterium]
MKTMFVTCLLSVAFLGSVFGQDPTVPPTAPMAITPAPIASPAAPIVSPSAPIVSPTASRKDGLERRINEKVKRHLNVTIGNHDRDRDSDRSDNHQTSHDSDLEDVGALMAIPIVGIIFTAIFGTPVLIVAAIMFFSYLKSRSLHRTVRMMVEKGQPVPPELFAAAPSAIRARSDMRRGVVLMMIGVGVMVFLGAVNDWEGGAWSLGIIPFLIGAGHLLVWKLEGNKPAVLNTSTDNPPRIS